MDYDLFEIDDDFIWPESEICTEKTQKAETNYQYPMLSCSVSTLNTVSTNNFSEESFVRSSFIFKDNYRKSSSTIEFTNYGFTTEVLSVEEILKHVIRHARMSIQILNGSLKRPLERDGSYFEQRKQITFMYHTLLTRNNLISLDVNQNLVNIRKLLNSVVNDEVLSSICMFTPTQNESKSGGYHLLHGFLEWRFLDLMISRERESLLLPISETCIQCKEYSQLYAAFLNDLFIMSFFYFKKKKITNIINICCFPCPCVKEMWLLLQLLSEKYENELDFWKSFMTCIEKNRPIAEKCGTSKVDLILFEIWLTKGVLMLEGYNKNGIFKGPTCSRVSKNLEVIEKMLERFLKAEPSDEQIRVLLIILTPLTLDWCSPNANIPMILWEYFYKKITSPLHMTSLSSLPDYTSTGKGYLERIKLLLMNNTTSLIHNSNHSSFTLFIMILGQIIEKFIHSSQKNQIYKILGRVFVKFSLPKLLSLNEIGIHHIIELFLMLAFSSKLEDVAHKLRDKLMSITLEKITANQRICVTKGHMALLTYFFEANIDPTDYISKLLEQLSSVHNDLTVSKIIVIGMCDILKESKDICNGEHLFIGGWLSNFLNTCTSAEMESILQVFHSVFEKMKPMANSSALYMDNNFTNASANFFNSSSKHVLPFIEHSLSTTSSTWIPLLAADFCALTASFNGQQQFQSQLKSFIEASNYNLRSMLKFLLAVLDCSYAYLVDSTTIIQIWLKCLVLLSGNDEQIINLSKKVSELQEFRDVSNLQIDGLLSSKEPLVAFISAVGKNHDTCDNPVKKNQIADKFNSYLVAFDKWILNKYDKTDMSHRFYSFIAVVIFNCAKMVYVRSKVTCFFHVAVTRFILPCSVQIGKAPDAKTCQIIHKIWPVIVQGIGKLNFNTDPYLNKTLSDLIIKWTPHFKTNAKPFVNCITDENEQLSRFVFEKLASTFLTTQRRQPQSSALQIIVIFKEVVTRIASNEAKMNIFVGSTAFVILEHLMMVDIFSPTSKTLLDLIEIITKAVQQLNSHTLRIILSEKVKQIVVKHLAHCSFFCFQLLTQIANVYTELIEEILPFLEAQIKVVEEKRGSHHDNKLRNCFDKLNETILITNMKNNKKT